MGFEIYPYLKCWRSACVIEPYNALLSFQASLNSLQLSVNFDNEMVHYLCYERLRIKRPSYDNYNCLMRKPISSITSTWRFEDEYGNQRFNDYIGHLIPFPRLHFLITGYSHINYCSKSQRPERNWGQTHTISLW